MSGSELIKPSELAGRKKHKVKNKETRSQINDCGLYGGETLIISLCIWEQQTDSDHSMFALPSFFVEHGLHPHRHLDL